MKRIESELLPPKIYLEDYSGDYKRYIEAVYDVFDADFVKYHPCFGKHRLGLKRHPEFQHRAYTFYHMTHKGEVESERTPDLRRCECMPWGKPTVERTEEYALRFWEQERKGKHRICIWLAVEDGTDYFFIIDVRKTFLLPWTAFVSEYPHELRKKEKEYKRWLEQPGNREHTPDSLVQKIMDDLA